ncbi:hypothetical protein Tsubulata_047584 [Turnera subulata]|uniref:U-box domain-containing protein n=1 Tax=Turnera subulata TaxID=218843 RepID=A0A9Q0F2E9_9ROSI|nr:hypothetical protein Tsubulata_047584 [Turnera subulata]
MLTSFDQIPNHTLRKMIQDWCVENQNHGVERIPTPRVPVSQVQVYEVLLNIQASVKRLDQDECLGLVHKIKKWGNESERNRRSIIANGTTSVLAAAFDAFAAGDHGSFEKNSSLLLEEILSVISWMFPLGVEAQKHFGSRDSLRCMVWFLKCGDISAKKNSLIVLQELLCSGHRYVEALAKTDEVTEVLFRLVKYPIGPSVTKAALMVLFYLVSSSTSDEGVKSALVKMGLVSLLLEVIIDSEKSISERALGVFDSLCDSEEGRKEAYGNVLTIPVLVKKLLRVSALATQFSVSALLKLSKHDKEHEEMVLVEALQVGAFQKLVLLLQLGCGGETKEKASEILKIMNPYRAGLECLDSSDFKNLKRSF